MSRACRRPAPPRALGPATALALATLLLTGAGCAEAAESRAFVLTSDFTTGRLSVIDLTTRAVSPDVAPVHSDAVMRWHCGRLYVVNRFGQDNVQVIDPAAGYATVLQFSTGNGSNPQDIAFATERKAYVTRYESSDLLVVDPTTGTPLGAISLAAFADADGLPEMARMIRVGRWLFVALQRLDRNAGYQADTSLVAVIDTEADTVLDVDPARPGTQAIVLTGRNPVTVFARDPASGSLLLGCAGRYGVLDGGIEWLDPVAMRSLGWAVTEAALGGDVGDLAWNGAEHSYAIVSDAAFNASLVAWSAATQARLGTVYAPGGFFLPDCELDDRGELYLCHSDLLHPGVLVFRAGADTLIAGPLAVGLPPQQVAFDESGACGGEVELPPGAALALGAPWPNPARGAVRLPLRLARAGEVRIEVFDLVGRRVRTLSHDVRPEGQSDVPWDLTGERGERLPAGLYVVRARAAGTAASRRVVVLR